MAFLSIKSTCFLLIITIAFSSSFGGVEGFVGRVVSKGAGYFNKVLGRNGKNVAPASDNIVVPPAQINGNQGLKGLPSPMKMRAENLADKYFGPVGKRGFRLGWNGFKYYLKAADKCETYKDLLQGNRCTHQSPPSNGLMPNCFAKCVVEIGNTLNNETPLPCISYDDNSCNNHTEPMCNGVYAEKRCIII